MHVTPLMVGSDWVGFPPEISSSFWTQVTEKGDWSLVGVPYLLCDFKCVT